MKLKELLEHYDFTRHDKDLSKDIAWNTRTVRIYFNEYFSTSNFFEIGCGIARDAIGLPTNPKDFIREDVLNRTISRYYCDEELGILFILLESEEEE